MQTHHDDTVASIRRIQRVIVQTLRVQESRSIILGQSPSYRVTLADGCLDSVVNLFPDVDMYVVYTVVTVHGLSAPYIIAGLGDVIQTTPCVRSLFSTDIQRVVLDVVCLVYSQAQAVDAVASVTASHHNAVFSREVNLPCGVNRIVILVNPCVTP